MDVDSVAPISSNKELASNVQRTQEQQKVAEQEKKREESSKAEEAATVVARDEELTSTEKSEVKKTVSEINNFLDSMNKSLSFFIDDDSGRYGVKVIDKETKEVIKQIPPKEVLDMSSKIKEMLGSLIDKSV